MLLALLTVQRVQTLHVLRLENISFTDDYVQIVVSEKLKTSRPNYHIEPFVFTRYSKCKSLCIVRYLEEYIKRTKLLRGTESQLFISYQKPYQNVTKSTISRWVKSVLKKAGINVSVYSVHSTRAAGASKVFGTVSIEKILKAGGWSSDSCFMKHYNLVSVRNQVQDALLSNV